MNLPTACTVHDMYMNYHLSYLPALFPKYLKRCFDRFQPHLDMDQPLMKEVASKCLCRQNYTEHLKQSIHKCALSYKKISIVGN